MKTARRLGWTRGLAWAAAAALMVAVSGDVTGAVLSGNDPGIDPLDVLDLQVKPNVIIVLDSSGSMKENLNATVQGSGDFPNSKMKQAKDVLKSFITTNKTSANFLFGQYTQTQTRIAGPGESPYGSGSAGTRFVYQTTTGTVGATEVRVNGFTSFSTLAPVTIVNGVNNRLYFQETTATGANPPVATSCTAQVAAGTYTTMAAFATAVQNAMNAVVCAPAKVNTYSVTVAAGPRFAVTKTGGGRSFRILNDRIGGVATPGSMAMLLGLDFVYSGSTPNYASQATNGTITSWLNGNSSAAAIPPSLLTRTTAQDSTIAEDTDLNPLTPPVSVTRFRLYAARFWNGETVAVDPAGNVCSITPGVGGVGSDADPFFVNVRLLNACPAGAVQGTLKYTFAGATFGGNNVSCNGFQTAVPLRPCTDPTDITLQTNILLDYELPRDTATQRPQGYNQDNANLGNGLQITSEPPFVGVRADGSTPIANSLISIRTIFGTSAATGLWGAGQATPAKSAIRLQDSPRERTIILFVTDGEDTCANRPAGAPGPGGDDDAKRAALMAERLYTVIPDIDPLTAQNRPESSVTTYVIGFGLAGPRLDWVAWGGSGLGQGLTGQPNVTTLGAGNQEMWNETTAQLAAKRAACTTCVDAFIAPDADTLARTLQAILDQGVQTGEFTATPSVFAPLYELVREVDTLTVPPLTTGDTDFSNNQFHPDAPNTRYLAIVPNLFRTSFVLPGFKGQVKAFQNTKGEVSLKWNAGNKLYDRVTNALVSCNLVPSGAPATGQCQFADLLTRIDRRIYTTSRNGVFGASIDNLLNVGGWVQTNGNRTVLWPAGTTVAPTNDTGSGILDVALGLPTLNDAAAMTTLVKNYGACLGTGRPAVCGNGTTYPSFAVPVTTPLNATQVQRARREAREKILAKMAGAEVVLNAALEPARITGGAVLFKASAWMLADSTVAQPLVAPPPIESEPTGSGFEAEYRLMRDGPRTADPVAPGAPGNESTDATLSGLGLRNPDKDSQNQGSAQATTGVYANLKPTMNVLYLGANDMLHAFRAAPNCPDPAPYDSPDAFTTFTGYLYTACNEQGGEELWGFVPFDQLGKLKDRLVTQTRTNHTYMIAAGLRFADVFVPNPGTDVNRSGATVAKTFSGSRSYDLQGVWRRILYFGRGPAGKHVTALDVTTPGPYKTLAANTLPPVVLWNRGNPDTLDGTAAGTASYSAADKALYARMGQTWSVPTVAFVDRTFTTTTRKGSGIDFVIYMGSGYGDTSGCPLGTCEGQAIFSLDALTGDVIAAPQVGQRTPLPQGGHPEAKFAFGNSIVANVTAFNPLEFQEGTSPHPAASKATRVYVGDVHGRLWKVLTSAPGTAILFSDFGPNQPIGVGAALLGYDNGGTITPYVYVTTGHDRRVDPSLTQEPFLTAGFVDVQADTDATSPAVTTSCLPSVVDPCLWVTELEQQVSGLTQYFRGSVQPATFFVGLLGRVAFGAVAFNPPSSPFAPPGCPGPGSLAFPCSAGQVSPCRSSFDSLLGLVGAKSGLAGFDLNDQNPDDTFLIYDNSKMVGLSLIATATTGGGGLSLVVDEGLNRAPGAGDAAGTAGKPSASVLSEGGRAPSAPATGGVATTVQRGSSTVCQ